MELQPTIKPLQSEIDAIHAKALREGRDPEEALAALGEKIRHANARIAEDASERAFKKTGEFFSKNKLN